MRIVRTRADHVGYVWVCTICYYHKRVNKSTPLNAINILLFDLALSLWIRNATPDISIKLSSRINTCDVNLVFRRSFNNYMARRIYPFLKLPGPVEIDEAKIGVQRWHFKGEFPKNIKWAFGLYCRST
jgi:hypothetical protein